MTASAPHTLPLSALGLLLVAAICHAAWNLLLKKANEKFIATWWALIIVSLLSLPLLAFSPALPREIWPYVLCSAACEAAYYTTLAAAYRDGDFSLVYPIARGAAPALLMLWSVLFLGERPQPAGVFGVGVILLGLLLLATAANFNRQKAQHAPKTSSIALALLTALFISMYSAIDGAAVKRCSPLPYTVLIFATTAVMMTPFMLWRYRREQLWREARAHGFTLASVGILSLVAYALVLGAYTLGPVSYAGAVREVSVVFGALAGWLWLGESFGPRRTFAAAMIFFGIFTIALRG
jgi:drug/metabolite transporter (DMT)-like permease